MASLYSRIMIRVSGSIVSATGDQFGLLYLGKALRTPEEEFMGAFTHAVGLAASLVAGAALLAVAIPTGSFATIVGCAFYCASLAAVYAASTLSHLYLPERMNRRFRSLDQGCIYLLIVGTFTPFAVKYLMTPAWIGFYAVVLVVACGGFLSKTVYAHRLQDVSVWLYVVLGWGEALAIPQLVHVLPPACIFWLVCGGLCYTIGTIFLVVDLRKYQFHAVWHLLVICGSACHYIAIYRLVAATG